jgi:hypothetical protein
MSRGLGKTERAILAALPEDGSLRSIYDLALAIYGPWHMDKYTEHPARYEHIQLADPYHKRNIRRAVVRLERAGLVETRPCMLTVPKVGYRDECRIGPGMNRQEAIAKLTRTPGLGVRRATP